MPEAAVVISDLVKRYGATLAVDDLSFEAAFGQVTAVLGPNGAGKTSTLECLVGLRKPDGGTVRVLDLDPVRDAKALRARTGVMLQDGGLTLGARAGDVLRHIASLYATPRPVEELVERLSLASFLRTGVRHLSGGQRQRLALAVALVGRPELVLLDEPSAGMDPQSRRVVWDLVSELRSEGVAVLLTTHLMDEAEALADAVVVVDHGTVIARGTVAELTRSTGLVRLTVPDGLDTAALASTVDAPVREAAPGQYVVEGAGTPELLATLTAACAAQGAQITSLDVGRRTLEDVFLDLTGRQLR
ncbi:MAG: ABC transporter ATP-binding protein [Actinomycetales bacterium]|nr:ABC transporter ATP-binding protein [Actinomycetales bacterium]